MRKALPLLMKDIKLRCFNFEAEWLYTDTPIHDIIADCLYSLNLTHNIGKPSTLYPEFLSLPNVSGRFCRNCYITANNYSYFRKNIIKFQAKL